MQLPALHPLLLVAAAVAQQGKCAGQRRLALHKAQQCIESVFTAIGCFVQPPVVSQLAASEC